MKCSKVILKWKGWLFYLFIFLFGSHTLTVFTQEFVSKITVLKSPLFYFFYNALYNKYTIYLWLFNSFKTDKDTQQNGFKLVETV